MLRNYLTVALRNLRKNRLYSVLNILGLAVGLASGILILLYVADEFRYNHFHRNLAAHGFNGGTRNAEPAGIGGRHTRYICSQREDHA